MFGTCQRFPVVTTNFMVVTTQVVDTYEGHHNKFSVEARVGTQGISIESVY